MKDVNKVILVGRLGKDPVQTATKKGTTVVHFPLATSRRVSSEQEGEGGLEPGARPPGTYPKEETQWHRVVAWGKQGELCAQFLKKGQPVYVEGSYRSRKYQTQDGQERYMHEVHAESVVFLSQRRRAPEASEESAPLEATG
jgi:single-strand DNA-binding protein